MADTRLFAAAVRNLPILLKQQLSRVVAAQAQRLAGEVRAALGSHQHSGHLTQSVRVVPGAEPMHFTVIVGGPETTKRVRHGRSAQYDYALAEEYGTQREAAKPFFWSTVRRLQGPIRDAIAQAVFGAMADETVIGLAPGSEEMIAGQEAISAARGQPFRL